MSEALISHVPIHSKSNNIHWLVCALMVTVNLFVDLETYIQQYNKMVKRNTTQPISHIRYGLK